jgi:organic hydroperoxide reductase OsmC/OhrA
MGAVHEYRSRLDWIGSTADGYERYSRAHEVVVPGVDEPLELSSDPAFRGDSARLNPEQLLLVAASSCQLLEFIAIAARARIDVVSYSDEADAVMPEDSKPMRITRITLRPHVVVVGDMSVERIRRYLDLAHEHCYVANSISSEIAIEPRIEVRAPGNRG